VLALTVTVAREAETGVMIEMTASVESRRDQRGATDGDWVIVAHRASQALGTAAGAGEAALLLSDWRAGGGLAALPEALANALLRVQGAEIACALIARGDGSTLLLTDLPARLGLRGGTYVQRSVVSLDALARALAGD